MIESKTHTIIIATTRSRLNDLGQLEYEYFPYEVVDGVQPWKLTSDIEAVVKLNSSNLRALGERQKFFVADYQKLMFWSVKDESNTSDK